MTNSIFDNLFDKDALFIDRYAGNPKDAVDIIIPIINTNELFERNLYNFYERIPVNRLLIGDGGCTDKSVEIAQKFPRVQVFDHSDFSCLGKSIALLIESVKTDIFVYLHADVFLPENWFESMYKYKDKYDWYECGRRYTVLIDYDGQHNKIKDRAYSGSQMGRKKAFSPFLEDIEDGFLQRNEDIIFAELIKSNGGRYGLVDETYHHHQLMDKRVGDGGAKASFGFSESKYDKVIVERSQSDDWLKEVFTIQVRGLIKYCSPISPPNNYLVRHVNGAIAELYKLNSLQFDDLLNWTKKENPDWVRYLKNPEKYSFFELHLFVKRHGKKILNFFQKK